MKTTSSVLRWLITLAACAAIAAILYLYNNKQSAANAPQQPPEFPEMIEAIAVSGTTWSPKTKTQGEVVATRSLTLRNELEGAIIELNLPSGGTVEKGQVLIRLDIREENARLANANANLELAQIELKRTKELADKKLVSQVQYDSARIQVKVRQAEIQGITSVIERKTIVAPFDAQTSLHTLEVGQFLAANSVINTLVGIDNKIWVDFNLPQQYVNIDRQTEVLIEAPFTEQPLTAKVIAQNISLNRASRSLTFRAELDNSAQLLKPGTVVNVSAPTAAPTSALKIPTSAIIRDQFSTYVYRLSPSKDNKNYRANRQNIQIGGEYGAHTVVTSGLEMNDLIVSIGGFKLRPNMLVNFTPTPALEPAQQGQ
jgi:membrane fusion protein (multidrug efflux system)